MKKKVSRKLNNQWTAKYDIEPLRTFKEIELLAQKGIKRYIIQEVNKGRMQKEVAEELKMTRANVQKIMRIHKESKDTQS